MSNAVTNDLLACSSDETMQAAIGISMTSVLSDSEIRRLFEQNEPPQALLDAGATHLAQACKIDLRTAERLLRRIEEDDVRLGVFRELERLQRNQIRMYTLRDGGYPVHLRAMICLTNVRSLGQAAANFNTENKGYFPQPAGSESRITNNREACWYNALDDYVGLEDKGTAATADDREDQAFKQDPAWGDFPTATKDYNRTIKMNNYFGRPAPLNGVSIFGVSGDLRWVKIDQIEEPSKTVIFGDGIAEDLITATDDPFDLSVEGHAGSAGDVRKLYGMFANDVGLRHNGGANMGLVDGSASAYQMETQQRLVQGGVVLDTWYTEDQDFDAVTFEPLGRQELIWKIKGSDSFGNPPSDVPFR